MKSAHVEHYEEAIDLKQVSWLSFTSTDRSCLVVDLFTHAKLFRLQAPAPEPKKRELMEQWIDAILLSKRAAELQIWGAGRGQQVIGVSWMQKHDASTCVLCSDGTA